MNFTEKQVEILDVFLLLYNSLSRTPTQLELKDAGISRELIRTHFGSLGRLVDVSRTIESGIEKKDSKEDTQNRMIRAYVKILKEKRMTPSYRDFSKVGITPSKIRNFFGNITSLRQAAKAAMPEEFAAVIDSDIFTEENASNLRRSIEEHRVFVITTAVTGMPVKESFLKTIENFCQINNAKLLVLPTTDPAAIAGFELDGALPADSIVIEEVDLNENLMISTFKTSAKQINPLTGLKRMGMRERSIVVASPKQFLEYVPIANDNAVHALMTTGAVTAPDYHTDRYMSLRTAYIADMDHKLGAVIVEIKDNKTFHFRQIQADVWDGTFIDLGVKYFHDHTESVKPEAIVLGDIHVGSTSVEMMAVTDDQIKTLKPKRVFLHDIFDGISCSHHLMNQKLTKASFPARMLSIRSELMSVKDYLDDMRKKHKDVEEWVIVRSNHDDFIDRYLETGRYIDDPLNTEISHEIAIDKLTTGRDGLEIGLGIVGLNPDKIKFLKINSSYKIAGIEHGVHGHIGLNGQRNPGNGSLEVAYGAITAGHSHSAGILRDVFRVGTSTNMRLGYNNGASSWTNTNSVTYSNGSRQLLNNIKGSWRKQETKKKKKSKK